MHRDGLDPESELRHALDLLDASRRALYGSIGAEVIETDWQPGQPVPEHVQRLRCGEADLRRVIEDLPGVVAQRYG